MTCPRCAGLMIRDNYLDLQDETGQCRFVAWRCLICGEVLDPVILKHRSTRPEPMMDRARPHFSRCVSLGARKRSDHPGDPWGDPEAATVSLVSSRTVDRASRRSYQAADVEA